MNTTEALLVLRAEVAEHGMTYDDGAPRNPLAATRISRRVVLDFIDAALAAANPEPARDRDREADALAGALARLGLVRSQRDQAWRNLDTAHEDIAAMLRASGLGDYARPISTHDVIQTELLPWIEAHAAAPSPADPAPREPA